MLNRRLWILFLAFLLGFSLLAVRLAKLQLADASQWRDRLSQFVHRHHVIETYRGSILDRNGLVLAQDVPSDELAIDYRAMNLDDTWLAKKAIERLRAAGEWGHFADRAARTARLEQVKNEIAAQIDAIPDAIARALAPVEGQTVEELRNEILQRYSDIRERIHAMRLDIWTRKFIRNTPDSRTWSDASSTGPDDTDTDDAALDSLFRQLQLEDEVATHTLRANIPPPVALYFKQHLAEFPGLVVRDNADHNRRDYPFGPATAHIVGTLRSVEQSALAAHKFDMPDLLASNDPGDLKGYLPGDRMGETGIERLAEDQLRGTRGVGLIDLGQASPAADASPPSDSRRIDPLPGADVRLTLDAALQRDLYNALLRPGTPLLKGEDNQDHFVALVVLAMNGEILAAITYPSYDPARFDVQRVQLMRDEYRTPLVNRAFSGAYQPGSTVKPLLASAALTERVITPDEDITCLGHFFARTDIFRCDRLSGHGPIAMVEALAQSCNVYFYTVGQRLGLERLSTWYGNYGFGRDTGMELPETRGDCPSADIARTDPTLASREALLLGIGQGPVSASPLQMANAYATLLRGGLAIAPRILADTPPHPVQLFSLSPQTLATVTQGMKHCTSEGTGREYFGPFNIRNGSGMKLRIAGKTGTAEKIRPLFDQDGNPIDDLEHPLTKVNGTPILKPDGTPMYRQLTDKQNDAWFVGYAPADNPQFIVAAVMEWGGHGGAHAAPMVKEAFLQLEAHGYLPRLDVP